MVACSSSAHACWVTRTSAWPSRSTRRIGFRSMRSNRSSHSYIERFDIDRGAGRRPAQNSERVHLNALGSFQIENEYLP